MEWKSGAASGQVVAGTNGHGERDDQLNYPTIVIIDKENDYFIITVGGWNSRVVRWPRQNGTSAETIIWNVTSEGLAMDDDGYLYVSDVSMHEVRRWKVGDTSGTIVAGGNGNGIRLDQLDSPRNIFVDEHYSVYVSERGNHRVTKWLKDAKEGMIVAGGQGEGNSSKQLSNPGGIIVDQLGTVYIADCGNDRIVRWLKGATEGNVLVGGHGRGGEPYQFSCPLDLSFDPQNNLYVVDYRIARIQKFYINSS